MKDGNELGWEAAVTQFKDVTGRPGPATWEGSRYPEGQDNYPVRGVSWYEAAAYCESVGKSLPTIVHWYKAADVAASPYVVPVSNLSGTGPAQVGRFRGLGTFGTYDMAGNVREWAFNEMANGRRFLLGGAWHDPPHMFTNNADARPAFERGASAGFRCVKYTAPLEPGLLVRGRGRGGITPILSPFPSEVFKAFLGQF